MKEKPFIERRRYPRIEKKLPLQIITDKYDISTETKNLSCIGAYCSIDRDIPVLTKLSITILLPGKSKNKYTEVRCKGVVVRKEKNPSGGFNIGIFFNDITQKQKEKISKYIYKHSRII
jgi:c-di-GMP-binding flagellar brake protein YcgR